MWLHLNDGCLTYIVGVCYNPPKPQYSECDLLIRIGQHLDYLCQRYPQSVIVFTGDLNQLKTIDLETDYGLNQLVSAPTHQGHILDKFFTSDADLFQVVVVDSSIRTKHKALIITGAQSDLAAYPLKSPSRVLEFYDVRAQHIAVLKQSLSCYSWTHVLIDNDINSAYTAFVHVLRWHIAKCIPAKRVTLSSRRPAFVSPLIKSLLRKRNKLLHKGGDSRIQRASDISVKIGKLIREQRAQMLATVDSSNTRELWAAVKKNSRQQYQLDMNKFVDADNINRHFAHIATDINYERHNLLNSNFARGIDNTNSVSPFNIFKSLSTLKKTSPGPDGLPYWLFRECASELTPVVTYLVGLSLSAGTPPDQWKHAVITPIPKVIKPTSMSELRPISVTSIMSRVTERIIVSRYIMPAFPADWLNGQYAYRPTGSTTAALTAINHHVSKFLETNKYVRCLQIDFSKAFDSVNHSILARKLSELDLPANIYNWIMGFLTGRTQSVVVNGCVSRRLDITRSIVQGSGLGPSLYLAYSADLILLSLINILVKYADDTYVLVPENTDVSLEDEFRNIIYWSELNKLLINLAKCKELVFHRPQTKSLFLPVALDGVEQVSSSKILGIIVTSTMSFTDHVNWLLKLASQRLYLLNQLKKQGLDSTGLSMVFQALIVSRFIYALPAFYGHVTESDISRVDKLFNKCFNFGITKQRFRYKHLAKSAECKLIKLITNMDNHCLHNLLPPERDCGGRNLRYRSHNYQLPLVRTELFKSCFINRYLFGSFL